MKKAAAGLCALALAVPALAVAHDKTFESTITVEYAVGSAAKGGVGPTFIGGLVHSEKPGCIADRKVKLFAYFSEGTSKRGAEKVLIDTDRTSQNGAWAGYGDFTGSIGAQATVVKKDIGPRRHDHVCGADTDGIG